MAFDLDDEENEATRIANGASKESRDKNINIEVGEYVRTKIGEIYKVENIEDYGFMCDKFYYQITKHSKQLIDLIEVGDYVNGKYVKEIKGYENGKSILALIGIIEEQDIKTILTKESYIANCYKVGGEDE